MNFLKKILDTYQKGLEYDSLQAEKQELQAKHSSTLNSLKHCESNEDELEREISGLLKQINELEEQLKVSNKHSSLENYKKYLDSIPAKAKYYNFGKGRRRVHTVLQHSLQDENIIRSFVEEDLGFNPEHDDTADKLVFHFVRVFNSKLPTKKYYASDKEIYGEKEYWASAKETIELYRSGKRKVFDCFTGDTKIIVKNKLTGCIENKTFLELKDSYYNYQALSYNVDTQKTEFKDITNFIDKGERQVVEATFKNGGSVKVTPEHKFLMSKGKNNITNKYKYDWTSLKDVDLSNSRKKQSLAVTKISDDDGVEIPEQLCNLIASYVADGNSYVNKNGKISSITIAGDDKDRQSLLKQHLDMLGIDYKQSNRTRNAYTTLYIDNNGVKELIKEMGIKGTFKQFPDIVMKANSKSIEKILYYYGQRDGTKNKDGSIHTYSTVSNKLAEQIKLLLTKVGTHYSHYVQNYQYSDANRQPIHRIRVWYDTKERLKHTRHNSIIDVKEAGVKNVYDITVADNHNFVLSNSRSIVHNCDDVMILVYSCLYYLLDDKFPEEKWRLRGFLVDLWGNLGGHALLGWVRGDSVNDFVPIETTFMDTKQGFMWTKKYRIRNQLFYQIRYSFDNENEYSKI